MLSRPEYSALSSFVSVPHGGHLQDLVARDKSKKLELLQEAAQLPSLILSERQTCDLELILNGGFSPLDGFLSRPDYESVLTDLRLTSGLVWSMPINLDVSTEDIEALSIQQGSRIALLNPQDEQPLAILNVQDIYRPDKKREAELVFGKDDSAHPAVAYLHSSVKEFYIGGPLEAISLPAHYDYLEHRNSPAELRLKFEKWGWSRIVAFQTRNPMHRAHRELTVRAARENKCTILIHPVVGLTKPGDIDHYTRVRVYKSIIQKYPDGMATLSLLPLAMRMGGPREAVWHAIIRKNYGCTHFIVGRDHAGPGKDSTGADFYGPYDAQDLVEEYKSELDITVVPFKMVSYLPESDEYVPADLVPPGAKTLSISGTELRRRLKTGAHIPDWFTYPDVQKILRQVHPPRSLQGYAVLFVGDSPRIVSAALGLEKVLNQRGQRPTTLLVPAQKGSRATDVDALHFTFVAGEVVKNGGAVIAAPLFHQKQQRDFIERIGADNVILVHDSAESTQGLDLGGGKKKVDLEVDSCVQSTSQIVQQVILSLESEAFIGER